MKRALPLLALAFACGSRTVTPVPAALKSSRPVERVLPPPVPPLGLPEPPPEAIAIAPTFPTVSTVRLDNGLGVAVVEGPPHGVAELRLVVGTGAGDDLEPGTGRALAALTLEGGAGKQDGSVLTQEVESHGGRLGWRVDLESTTFVASVDPAHTDRSIETLALLVREPRLPPPRLPRILRRMIATWSSDLTARGALASERVLFGELFDIEPGVHPLAKPVATPAELLLVDAGTCKRQHRAQFIPGRAVLIATGSVSNDAVVAAARRAFESWRGESRSRPDPGRAASRGAPKVHVIDRPRAPFGLVSIALTGPKRDSNLHAAFTLAAHLAPARARVATPPVSSAPTPIVFSLEAQTSETASATSELVDALDAIGRAEPTDADVERLRRERASGLVGALDSAADLADALARQVALGEPLDAGSAEHEAVGRVTAAEVAEVAHRWFRRDRFAIVVAGDASLTADSLREIAEVVVLDAERDMKVMRTLPREPRAIAGP